MAKLTDAEFAGFSGNITNVSSWTKIILGAVMVLIGFSVGQGLVGTIGRKLPMVDTQIDPLWSTPTIISTPQRASIG